MSKIKSRLFISLYVIIVFAMGLFIIINNKEKLTVNAENNVTLPTISGVSWTQPTFLQIVFSTDFDSTYFALGNTYSGAKLKVKVNGKSINATAQIALMSPAKVNLTFGKGYENGTSNVQPGTLVEIEAGSSVVWNNIEANFAETESVYFGSNTNGSFVKLNNAQIGAKTWQESVTSIQFSLLVGTWTYIPSYFSAPYMKIYSNGELVNDITICAESASHIHIKGSFSTTTTEEYPLPLVQIEKGSYVTNGSNGLYFVEDTYIGFVSEGQSWKKLSIATLNSVSWQESLTSIQCSLLTGTWAYNPTPVVAPGMKVYSNGELVKDFKIFAESASHIHIKGSFSTSASGEYIIPTIKIATNSCVIYGNTGLIFVNDAFLVFAKSWATVSPSVSNIDYSYINATRCDYSDNSTFFEFVLSPASITSNSTAKFGLKIKFNGEEVNSDNLDLSLRGNKDHVMVKNSALLLPTNENDKVTIEAGSYIVFSDQFYVFENDYTVINNGTKWIDTTFKLTYIYGDISEEVYIEKNSSTTLMELPLKENMLALGWSDNSDKKIIYSEGTNYRVIANTQLTAEYVDYNMANGASIKLTDNADTSGIRFMSKLNSEEINNKGNKILGIGIIIIPTDLIGGNEITLENFTDGVNCLDYYAEADSFYVEDGFITLKTSLSKLYSTNYNREFSARAYIKYDFVGGAKNVYCDYSAKNNSRSIYYVAKNILADENNQLSETQIKIVESFANRVVCLNDVDDIYTVADGAFSYTLLDGVKDNVTKIATITLNSSIENFSCLTINGKRIKNTEFTYNEGVVTIKYLYGNNAYGF